MTDAATKAEPPTSETFPVHIPASRAAPAATLHAHRWLPTSAPLGPSPTTAAPATTPATSPTATRAAPRAIVLLAHGYAEHAGRYADVARRLNDAGLALYTVDHWGHGLSHGKSGYVPNFAVYLDGMQALLARAKFDFPYTPLLLLGHSMGGLIAARFLARHQQDFVAAALSGPALQAGAGPMPLTKLFSRLLSRIAPHVGVMALDSDGVSRDPALVARYRSDPLVYRGRMSARLAAEMLAEMDAAQQQAPHIHLPLLIQHGSADRLTAPDGSRRFFQALGSSDKQLKIYDGLYHEIYNEPERDEVIADVIRWFKTHLQG